MYVYIYKGILRNHLKIRHITSRYEILRHCIFDLRVNLATDHFYDHNTATCATVPQHAHTFLFTSFPSQTQKRSMPKSQHNIFGTTDC